MVVSKVSATNAFETRAESAMNVAGIVRDQYLRCIDYPADPDLQTAIVDRMSTLATEKASLERSVKLLEDRMTAWLEGCALAPVPLLQFCWPLS